MAVCGSSASAAPSETAIRSALPLLFLAAAALSPATAAVGDRWPSEAKTWTDPEFGHEITQWTNHAKPSWPLYFNIESFIDDDHAIVLSERTGREAFFQLNLRTGELTQISEDDPESSPAHWPGLHTLWYAAQGRFHAVDTRTFAKRSFGQYTGKLTGLTVTCDGRHLLYALDKAALAKTRRNVLGPFAVFRCDPRTGETVQISPDYGFVVNHLQASPTDPGLLTHAWQHIYKSDADTGIVGNTPFRIWWLKVDGSAGGPLAPQEFGLHRTHEFWFPDGSRLGYSARYKWGPNEGRQFLGSCRPDGSDNYMLELPVLASHPMVFAGGRYWVADAFNNEMILTLTTVRDRAVVGTEKLFRHNSTWTAQRGHPHARIAPSGRMILFGTDRTGVAQVHSVKVNLVGYVQGAE